jgi:hypothetical protein
MLLGPVKREGWPVHRDIVHRNRANFSSLWRAGQAFLVRRTIQAIFVVFLHRMKYL